MIAISRTTSGASSDPEALVAQFSLELIASPMHCRLQARMSCVCRWDSSTTPLGRASPVLTTPPAPLRSSCVVWLAAQTILHRYTLLRTALYSSTSPLWGKFVCRDFVMYSMIVWAGAPLAGMLSAMTLCHAFDC